MFRSRGGDLGVGGMGEGRVAGVVGAGVWLVAVGVVVGASGGREDSSGSSVADGSATSSGSTVVGVEAAESGG